MDGNLIKKICSGGDKIQMRTNYVNEIDVRIQGTLILFNNDMPKVEPADVFQKLVPFSLPSKFVDEINEDDIKKNPHYKLSDPNIKKFVSKEEVCEAFVWILIDSYKSTKLKLVDVQNHLLIILKQKMNLIYLIKTLKLLKMMMTELNQVVFKNF